MTTAPRFKRLVCLVADGFGVGEAPDADLYGDVGANTLGHIADAVSDFRLPHLERLGLGNLGAFRGIQAVEKPLAIATRLAEKSRGKDTTTGHWEMAGVVTREPMALFPDGFPRALVERFILKAKISGVLGNCAASGTQIIQDLGEEHLRSGKPILYTSGDSVFQLAAHEGVFGLENLYRICEVARQLTEAYFIGRVIARPFVGKTAADFARTENRRDYSLAPPANCLDALFQAGVPVLSVGKIEDIFDHRGITDGVHTGNNRDGLRATLDLLRKYREKEAFIFVNLVDFDMLYGHRRDPVGYARALRELDDFLPELLGELHSQDGLILTADHGCDPTFRGTDHTREYVPALVYRPGHDGARLPDRETFSDLAAILLDAFGVSSRSVKDVGINFLDRVIE